MQIRIESLWNCSNNSLSSNDIATISHDDHHAIWRILRLLQVLVRQWISSSQQFNTMCLAIIKLMLAICND